MGLPTHRGYNLIKEIYLLLDDGDRRFLKQFGLSPVQFYALLWLDGSQGKTLGQLSRDLLCDPGNVTRLTDRMEQKGLLVRQRDTEDRRMTWVSLTTDGQALCNQLRQDHTNHVAARMNILSDREQAALEGLLMKLRNGLEEQLNQSPEPGDRFPIE